MIVPPIAVKIVPELETDKATPKPSGTIAKFRTLEPSQTQRRIRSVSEL
jgi:hypothetical protein